MKINSSVKFSFNFSLKLQVDIFYRDFNPRKTVSDWKHLMPSYNVKNAIISTYENNIGNCKNWTPKEFALETLKFISDGITKRCMKHFMTDVNILKKIEDPDVAKDYDLYRKHVVSEVCCTFYSYTVPRFQWSNTTNASRNVYPSK